MNDERLKKLIEELEKIAESTWRTGNRFGQAHMDKIERLIYEAKHKK